MVKGSANAQAITLLTHNCQTSAARAVVTDGQRLACRQVGMLSMIISTLSFVNKIKLHKVMWCQRSVSTFVEDLKMIVQQNNLNVQHKAMSPSIDFTSEILSHETILRPFAFNLTRSKEESEDLLQHASA